jgi:hypothetical protein
MRVSHLIAICAFAAACGDTPGQSVCDNVVPPPTACMTMCDPKPGAANTCPGGYHCAADGFCDALCTPGGNQCGDGYECTPDGRCRDEGACEGLECQIVDCQDQGKPETTLKGRVFAPNGTLPLYGITVYVPNQPLGPFPDGAQCSRCNEDLPGFPLARAVSDENGDFTLPNPPAGANIPLVITSGKWRRQITIPNVAACTDNAVPSTETRLPKNKTEGDIPKIALTTGDADSLECLLRRMGIDDSEISAGPSGAGRIHLYHGDGPGAFTGGFPGGSGTLPEATTLWDSVDHLKPYDIVIFSCEGEQDEGTKPQSSLDAVKGYADLGGRVFLSHWHNIWVGGGFQVGNGQPAIASWTPIATWGSLGNPPNPTTVLIDENNNPKGGSFATWMLNVMGSTIRGQIPVNDGRITALTLDFSLAERWTFYNDGANPRPQNFQFTTPQEAPLDQRCGKVVFSDMHVSGNGSTTPYPTGCGDYPMTRALSAQEKALAFMLFDLASCVGVLL